jgi:zinc/manganese transport system substrate-binding protein
VSKKPSWIRNLAAIGLALVTAGSLTACSETPTWVEGEGAIKIVASTNVWGDIAHQVAGPTATVQALIFNPGQDPHSFEASARDQLAVKDADIVVFNGGGYDDFMTQLLQADDTPPLVINAFDVATAANDLPTDRNEHIWFDTAQVRAVVEKLARDLTQLGADADLLAESRSEVDAKLQLVDIRTDEIASAFGGEAAFATEPLIHYLLADCGMTESAPQEFTDAIEEGRDVAPAVLAEATKALQESKFAVLNASTKTKQIDALLASAPEVKSFEVSELLDQHPESGDYSLDFFELLRLALDDIVEGARP